MKIILRPISKNNWSGIIRYANCTDHIGSYLTRTGRRYTGLTDLDTEELGKALNVDLQPNSEFWDTYSIPAKDKDIIIDTSSGPEEKLKYLFLKNHKRVAYGPGLKAGADYQLIESEFEAVEVNLKNRLKRRALLEFDKLTPEQMRKALRLFGYSSENVSNEVAESTLSRIVETEPDKFLSVWVDNTNKEIQFLIEEAAANNVIRKSKTTYKYGTDVIGYTLEDTIDYLKNPINQDLKKAILAQLDAKGVVFAYKKGAKSAVEEEIKLKETEELDK